MTSSTRTTGKRLANGQTLDAALRDLRAHARSHPSGICPMYAELEQSLRYGRYHGLDAEIGLPAVLSEDTGYFECWALTGAVVSGDTEQLAKWLDSAIEGKFSVSTRLFLDPLVESVEWSLAEMIVESKELGPSPRLERRRSFAQQLHSQMLRARSRGEDIVRFEPYTAEQAARAPELDVETLLANFTYVAADLTDESDDDFEFTIHDLDPRAVGIVGDSADGEPLWGWGND